MQTIRVVLDSALLRAADRVARQAQMSRSALIRAALREHLKRFRIGELEARDRGGYLAHPDDPSEIAAWEAIAEPSI